MALSADQTFKSESTSTCCDEWKKKNSKLQESRNALRQAVKVLENKINEFQGHNLNLKKAYEEERVRAKAEAEEKVKEYNARVSLENEVCSLKSEITAMQQKQGGDGGDGNEDVKGLQACVADREKEISRLKELLETEKRQANSERKTAEKERKKAAEAWKLLEEERNKTAEMETQIAKNEVEKAEEFKTLVGQLEKEVNEVKTKLASQVSTYKEATKKFKAEKQKMLAEKRNAELEMAKAKEMLEVEKQNSSKEKRRADVEIAKAKEMLENEKQNASKVKRRRRADAEMAKAKEMLEVEKQNASKEKRRAEAAMAKVEEQKALAEDSWKKYEKEKLLVDQLSQQVEEDKHTIQDLRQKIAELSSLRKPNEVAGVSTAIGVKAESTDVKLLKNQLKLEKTRAKLARQKFKFEASRHSILQHELGRLKIDFTDLLRRFDMLGASFTPLDRGHDQTKMVALQSENQLYMQNSNFMGQACNLPLSQMHSQFENGLTETCCTTMDVCDPLRTNMQHTPHLAISGGNYSESITGIDSKLKPLIRGCDRTKLQSSAINSSSESFSDGQLMGSQDTTALPVTASAKLDQEIFTARQNICNPSHKSVTENHRKGKRIDDTDENIANLSSGSLSDLHGLLYRKTDKCLEGGKEMLHSLNSLQEKNGRAHKKRKKSHLIPHISRDEKKGTEEAKAEGCEDENVCRHISCPASYTLETTQACGERICDSANNVDSIISFDKVIDGSYMKMLELENAADEECYKRAMNSPLSPSLPEIEFNETFVVGDPKDHFLEDALREDILVPRTDLFPSLGFDVINAEIDSSGQRFDVSSNSQKKPPQASKIEAVKSPHMPTTDSSRTSGLVEGGTGPLQNQLPKFFVAFSNIEDNDMISRIYLATKACIARCNLATQTAWAVGGILTALKMEETLLQKEKVSVLLTLMLFNFLMTTSMTFGKPWNGNLYRCLSSYADHIRTVMSDAETRILFLEIYPLHELLGLVGEFITEGKVIVHNTGPAEILSDCDLRNNGCLDNVNTFSSEVASSEQMVAGSIILASVCAAMDHVGFLFEVSYDILRLCKWDSLMVLTILHIFAYLGGEKFFDFETFGSMVTVLKSLVIFLEGERLSVATAPYLPSIDQLHTKSCTNVKCPFLEGAESIDIVACLLLEEIKTCRLQGIEQVDMSDFRFMSGNYTAGKCSIPEVVHCAISKNCDDAPCNLKNCKTSTQPGVLKNITFFHLSDVLSLLELVASKMSWHWSDMKLVRQLLSMLKTCVEENFAIAIVVLLGQLGRIGVDAAGYEDRGVENLRCNLFPYLCRTSSMKAGLSLQIATATALCGLLPLDLETLFSSNIGLPTHDNCVSEYAETLRKWFSGLNKEQQKLLPCILRCTNVHNK